MRTLAGAIIAGTAVGNFQDCESESCITAVVVRAVFYCGCEGCIVLWV